MSQRAVLGSLTLLRTIAKTAVHLKGFSSGFSMSNDMLTVYNTILFSSHKLFLM